MTRHVLLIGCGNMGFAMLQGWLARPGMAFHVVEPSDPLRARAKEAGALTYAEAADLPQGEAPQLAFLAVKPQVIDQVAPRYTALAGGGTTFVSIAAGVTIATLSDLLPGPTPITRQ